MLDFNFRRPISGIRASMSWPSPVSSVSRILVTFVPTFRVVPPPPASLTDFTSVTVSPSARILPKASRIAASEAESSPSLSWLVAAGAHSWAHIGHANKAPISYVNSLAHSGQGGRRSSTVDMMLTMARQIFCPGAMRCKAAPDLITSSRMALERAASLGSGLGLVPRTQDCYPKKRHPKSQQVE